MNYHSWKALGAHGCLPRVSDPEWYSGSGAKSTVCCCRCLFLLLLMLPFLLAPPPPPASSSSSSSFFFFFFCCGCCCCAGAWQQIQSQCQVPKTRPWVPVSVNIPIPTKIGSKIPLVLTHSHMLSGISDMPYLSPSLAEPHQISSVIPLRPEARHALKMGCLFKGYPKKKKKKKWLPQGFPSSTQKDGGGDPKRRMAVAHVDPREVP